MELDNKAKCSAFTGTRGQKCGKSIGIGFFIQLDHAVIVLADKLKHPVFCLT